MFKFVDDDDNRIIERLQEIIKTDTLAFLTKLVSKIILKPPDESLKGLFRKKSVVKEFKLMIEVLREYFEQHVEIYNR